MYVCDVIRRAYSIKHAAWVGAMQSTWYKLTLKWSRPSALPLVVKGGPYGP